MKIGFIGQGWIGKHYADDFESRGYSVVRYAKDEPHRQNASLIGECDIVFVAVPTPTTPAGFDFSAVDEVLKLVGDGKTAVIKSTLLPGTTDELQKRNPRIFVLHSPEFLKERTAAFDAANPNRNIIGLPIANDEYQKRAREVLRILPKAPYEIICEAKEAELIKYAGNCFLFTKVVFGNILFELSESLGCDWKTVRDAIAADPRIGASHLDPISENGRGAGGHCLIKDYAAFVRMYRQLVGDERGLGALKGIEEKNIDLLTKTKKDTDILNGVYGDDPERQ